MCSTRRRAGSASYWRSRSALIAALPSYRPSSSSAAVAVPDRRLSRPAVSAGVLALGGCGALPERLTRHSQCDGSCTAAYGSLAGDQRRGEPEGGSADAWPCQRGDDAGRVRRLFDSDLTSVAERWAKCARGIRSRTSARCEKALYQHRQGLKVGASRQGSNCIFGPGQRVGSPSTCGLALVNVGGDYCNCGQNVGRKWARPRWAA